jgi:hypothetical protein
MPASAAGPDLPGGGPPHPATTPVSLPEVRAFHEELAALRADFPQHDITRDATLIPARYVSRRVRSGVHPHTVVTPDPSELRAILTAAERLQFAR